MGLPFWVGSMLKRKVLVTRTVTQSAIPVHRWAVVAVVAAVLIGTKSASFASPAITDARLSESALGVVFGLVLAYSGMKTNRADLVWLGIYVLAISLSVLWWPGGYSTGSGTLAIAIGSGFIIAGLARLKRL